MYIGSCIGDKTNPDQSGLRRLCQPKKWLDLAPDDGILRQTPIQEAEPLCAGRVFTEGKRTLHFAWMPALDYQTANHVSRRQHNNVAKEGRRLMEGILVLLAALFLTGQVIAASRGLTNRMRRHKRLRENALRRPGERSD